MVRLGLDMTKSLKHWYPRYSGDYRAKTGGLSLVQHGAYTLLLDEYYNTGKPLDANASVLHRVCSALAPEEQEAVNFILERFFIKTDKGYINKRVEEELVKRRDISDKRKKAANTRHANAPANAPANAHANAPANAPANAHTSTSTSTSTSKTTKTSTSKSGDILNFDIERLLDDKSRQAAKQKALGWDLYYLMPIFNEWIKSKPPPDNPVGAFINWCGTYTKGKQL